MTIPVCACVCERLLTPWPADLATRTNTHTQNSDLDPSRVVQHIALVGPQQSSDRPRPRELKCDRLSVKFLRRDAGFPASPICAVAGFKTYKDGVPPRDTCV